MPDSTINRQVVNYDAAERNYRGLQFTAEKRFSNNWNAQASYTYSRTRGNHFATPSPTLGDYLDAQCRTTVDLTVGTNGIIPCAEVQNGANKIRRADLRSSAQLQAGGRLRSSDRSGQPDLRRADRSAVEVPLREEAHASTCCCRARRPTRATPATYFYNERGANPVDGMEWYLDTSFEGDLADLRHRAGRFPR